LRLQKVEGGLVPTQNLGTAGDYQEHHNGPRSALNANSDNIDATPNINESKNFQYLKLSMTQPRFLTDQTGRAFG
jgi:hypothetical protein